MTIKEMTDIARVYMSH